MNNFKINLNIKNYTENRVMIAGVFFLVYLFIFLCSVSFVHAETEISLDSTIRNAEVGNEIVVDLRLSASVDPVNVLDGTLVYDQNKLEIKGVSFDDSIISLWVKKPVVSGGKVGDVAGQISLTGGVPNGYVGKNGEIFKIIFRTKAVGTTTIDFKDSFAVFQNDGKGTKINPWMRPLTISIVSSASTFFGILISETFIYLLTWISLALALCVLIFILKKYAKHP